MSAQHEENSGGAGRGEGAARPVSKRAAALWAAGFAVALVGAVVAVRALQIGALMQPPPPLPPTAVTAAEARRVTWERVAEAVGTVASARGVMVSAEIGGVVRSIHFESGAPASEGQLLVQLDISAEEAQLRAAEADAVLARQEVERVRRLQAQNTISDAAVDQAEAQLKRAEAQADIIRAAIEKKTIRAPFAGRLGIRQVNLGEALKPGAPVVSLQALDLVYVDYSLPQQRLPDARAGLKVRVTTDAFPGEVFEGEVTAVNPDLDARTRSVRLQATLRNPGEKLRPGMFARVETLLDKKDDLVVVPVTAVLYSPFGDSVFVIEEKPSAGGGPAELVLSQRTVRPGVARGDFIAVEGVPEGARVVSSGVFKLSNGLHVRVDNRLAPPASETPRPEDS